MACPQLYPQGRAGPGKACGSGAGFTALVGQRWSWRLGDVMGRVLGPVHLLPLPQPHVPWLGWGFTATLGLTLQVVHKIVFWIFT